MEKQSVLTSRAFKRAETNLKNRLKSSYLKSYPHYFVPGYNLHDDTFTEDLFIEENIEQYQGYPYYCDLPKPLLPPAKLPRSVIDEDDPALQLLTIKSDIDDDIKRLKYYYSKNEKDISSIDKKHIKWDESTNTATTTVPKCVADVAKIIDMDPDPYFKGTYNWYYTGGSLESIQLNNSNILLFPFLGELVASPILPLEEFLWKPLFQNSDKCELSSTLYELKYSIVGNRCKVLGRHKYYCNFYMLSQHNNKYNLTEIHQQPSKVPYVSADLSLFDTNQYCTVNAERLVAIWDLTKMKCIRSNIVSQKKTLVDPWGSISFHSTNPNIIVFVDRCCIRYMDVRTSFHKPNLTFCPEFYLEKCENISLDVASRCNFCRYIGTSHSFLMCDDRSPEQCVQQKWTHQLKNPPLMARISNLENKELIVLSSQMAAESTIILNSWNEEETLAHSFNFPFTPPDIRETLNASQLQGMCLNPYLRNRFELSNTGSTVITSETGNMYLFIQNSIGDVYYQCITHDTELDKYSTVNSKAYCILNAWQNAADIQAETIVPLTFSEKANVQHVYESFTNQKLQLPNKLGEADELFEPSWKQSVEKLSSYVDILAPELLAVWDVCEELPLPITAAPHQKVLSWLESSSMKDVLQLKEEPEEIPSPINTQELISVSQEVDISQLDDSNVLQELLLPKVKTKPVRKKRLVSKKT